MDPFWTVWPAADRDEIELWNYMNIHRLWGHSFLFQYTVPPFTPSSTLWFFLEEIRGQFWLQPPSKVPARPAAPLLLQPMNPMTSTQFPFYFLPASFINPAYDLYWSQTSPPRAIWPIQQGLPLSSGLSRLGRSLPCFHYSLILSSS